MKKLILFIVSVFTTAILFGQSNSIPNPGFENWTVTYFQDPNGYQSSNDGNNGNSSIPVINVTRTANAYHGNYAVQLKTTKVGTDTVASYIAIGNPGGNSGNTGGAAISGLPSGIRLYYTYTKKALDSALVFVIFKKAGVTIGQYEYLIYDTTSSYQLFSQLFSPALSATPDTVIFAFASSVRVTNQHGSGSSGYAPGAVFQVDSVTFTGIATQPTNFNGDFENWHNDSSAIIQGWSYWQGSDSGNATRTTDAYTGKYAVQLTTGTCSGCGGGNVGVQGITSGINSNNNGPHGGLPYSMTKDTLEFYYKYTPSVSYPGDTALVSIGFHNGTSNQQWYNIYLKSTGGNYVKEDFPFQISGFTPDSVLIDIQSSYSNRNGSGNGIPSAAIGSILKVDNMRFLSQLPISISPSNPSYCSGGSVILTASGATLYTWSPSSGLSATTGSTVTANPLGTTTYTITGTAGSTVGTQKVVVTVNLPPTVNITPSSPSICKGNSVSLTANGTSVSYTWSPLKGLNDSVTATVVATPTATTNYTVTGTSSAGCKGVNVVNVKVNTPPTAGFTFANACLGIATTFTNTSTGATIYSWNFGDGTNSSATNPTHTYATSGTYTVKLIATSSTGCKDSISESVFVDPIIVVNVTGSNVSCNGSCNGSANSVVSGGTAPYSYLWSPGLQTIQMVSSLCPNTYSVTITDAKGCSNSGNVTISQPAALTVGITSSNTTCGQSNGQSNATPNGGTAPYTYSWNTIPNQTGSTATALTAGTYTVIVSDANGCSASGTTTIGGSSAPGISVKVTPSNCNSSNGIAIATVTGGTSPYKYSWNNGDTLKKDSNLMAGVYIVTVTDKNGCSSFKAATVSDTNGPVINVTSQTNNLCSGQSNGAISISVTGGKTPYKYSWSNGATTTSINGLQAGPYQVTATDATGCSDIKSITITAPTALSVNTSTTQAGCGVSNGSASITVSGGTSPYTYQWNNSATTSSISNVAASSYSVAITDKNGCTSSSVASVSNSSGPVITITSIVNANCTTGTKGAINISDSGGTAPYVYTWSNGATSSNISGLSAGNYNVTVTDQGGCKGTANATVTQVLPPAISMCMVTVDPSTNYNTIFWDKTATKHIARYNIYKETTAPGLFTKIGSLKSDTTCIFIDKLSNSLVQSWRYEISQVDSCGNESPLSSPHKTMHLTINQGVGGAVNLIWDNYQGLSFPHYIVYRDSVAGIASDSIGSVVNNGTYTFTDYPTPTSVHPWYYHMGIDNPGGCTPAIEAINYNASKSNTGSITILSVPTLSNDISSFEVFPNPTTGKFNLSIALGNGKQNIEVQVLNTIGQVLLKNNFTEVSGKLKKQIDLSGYSKGVYLVKVITSYGTMYRKVVIQ